MTVCRSGLIPVIAAVLSSCGPEDVTDRGFTVRDSAGITIVESLEPAWEEGEGWQLSPEPILDIGVVEGDPAYLLDRVGDVARGPDGRIAVADGGSEQVRLYDFEGRFIRAVGGVGDGPGEFRRLSAAFLLPADTIVAFGPFHAAVFDPSGDVARTMSFEPGAGELPHPPVALAEGGFALAWERPDYLLLGSPGAPDQILRTPATVLRYGSDGTLRDTLGVFPGHESAISDGGSRVGAAMFGRRLSVAAHGEDIFVATGEGYEIQVFGPDGSLHRVFRRIGLDLSLTQANVDSLVREYAQSVSSDPEEIAAMEQRYKGRPHPDQRAPYSRVLTDSEGCLWVGSYVLSGWPTDFDVFDPEGRWLGEVTVPEGFVVHEIGDDYVLGVGRDELGVEHVRMYGLTRTAT